MKVKGSEGEGGGGTVVSPSQEESEKSLSGRARVD